MTPYGHQLEHLLRAERERMRDEWFFKWHFIGKDGPVEIESFDGRKITYGGIKFWGTPREVYWRTLNRYARKKIDEVFREAEGVVKSYPYRQAVIAVEDVERNLTTFLAQIAEDAVQKDRILRGNGFEFPDLDRGRASAVLLQSEIRGRASALQTYLDAHIAAASNSAKDKSDVIFVRPSLWGIGIDLRTLLRRVRGKTGLIQRAGLIASRRNQTTARTGRSF